MPPFRRFCYPSQQESLQNQAKIEQRQIEVLQKKIEEYQQSYQGDSSKRLKIKNLQTEANTSRSLLNSFMASYLESVQALNIDKKPIRIVAPALPPTISTVPNKTLIALLSGITGLFLGMFIALVMERVQNVVQSAAQLENLFKLPVYITLPKVKKVGKDNSVDYLNNFPESRLAELIRSLFISLQLREPHSKSGARVVSVTSTEKQEGKTTIATWLAMTAVSSGKKVLMIDGNMRDPSVHKFYNLGNAKGLADYLSDRLPLDETIYKKHPSGVHIMTSKAIPTHALTLLSGERMEILMRRVRDMYDLVIIDCPTAKVYADSRMIAHLSDKLFYVVEAKKVKRDHLRGVVKQFTDMNFKNLAFILNKNDAEA